MKFPISNFNTESNLCCQTLWKVLEKWCYLVHVVKKSVRGKNTLCVRGNTVSVSSVNPVIYVFVVTYLAIYHTLKMVIFLQNSHLWCLQKIEQISKNQWKSTCILPEFFTKWYKVFVFSCQRLFKIFNETLNLSRYMCNKKTLALNYQNC